MSDSILYLVEADAAVDAAGTVATQRYSNLGYATQPSDSPANAFYADRIAVGGAGTITRQLFSGDKTAGGSAVGYGDITLVNTDGGLDALLAYSFTNRALVVKTGVPGQAFSSLQTILRATMDQLTLGADEAVIGLRDRLAELDQPHQRVLYAGSNALPAGLEGVGDLKGKPKPVLLGTAYNFSPLQVNTSRLIYQLNDGAINSVGAVYDGGVALTAGAVYSSQADMETNAPSASQYRVWPAGGYLRLGSSPVYEITCDATQGATSAARTTAQVLSSLALAAGISAGDINASDVTALDAASNAEVGLWFADDRTTLAAMDAVAPSAGAYFGFDRLGVLRMGQFAAPSGTPVLTIDQTNGADLERVPNADGEPCYRVSINHTPYETVQTSGLAAVSNARRAQLAQQYRTASAENLAVKTQYLAAQTLSRNTCLVSDAAAATEAARVLALYGVQRDTFRVRAELTPEALLALDLNAVVTLQWDRFALNAGRLMRVIAGEFDYALNTATLTLWG